MLRLPPNSTLFPYTTLFRSFPRRQPRAAAHRPAHRVDRPSLDHDWPGVDFLGEGLRRAFALLLGGDAEVDRKSTRLNSSHTVISYAVFCLKKKITATPVSAL